MGFAINFGLLSERIYTVLRWQKEQFIIVQFFVNKSVAAFHGVMRGCFY